jgi:hypothetical protein
LSAYLHGSDGAITPEPPEERRTGAAEIIRGGPARSLDPAAGRTKRAVDVGAHALLQVAKEGGTAG